MWLCYIMLIMTCGNVSLIASVSSGPKQRPTIVVHRDDSKGSANSDAPVISAKSIKKSASCQELDCFNGASEPSGRRTPTDSLRSSTSIKFIQVKSPSVVPESPNSDSMFHSACSSVVPYSPKDIVTD